MTVRISDPKAFMDALRAVLPAASRDKRYNARLMAVRVMPCEDGSAMIATDSHRIAVCFVDLRWPKNAEPFGLLCTALNNLARRKMWEPRTISVRGTEALLKAKDGDPVTVPLVTGDFPRNWAELVDPLNYGLPLCFSAQHLMESIDVAMTAPVKEDGSANDVCLRFDLPAASARLNRLGSSIGATITTEPVVTHFNAEYLLDGLAPIASGTAMIQSGIEGRPSTKHAYLITGPSRPEYRYALMGMMV